MRLATVLLFIVFACGSARASRTKSTSALENNYRQLSKRAWPKKKSEALCNPNAVTEAWKNKGSKIDSWPDADEAYPTTFELVPAIITKNTINISGRKIIQNQLNAFMATDELLGYAMVKTHLKRTYYIVRMRMGDTKAEAQEKGLNASEMLQLIVKANDLYKNVCGMDLSHCAGDNYGNYYVFKKGENNAYVQAHRISFKGAKPTGSKYKMISTLTTERDYCIQNWETEPK
ncbi:hypothetical protein APHAL10511_000317 [Amanita phalloides]|nr:hypothetical protein APHAL10511_000317 [Amanita phalloides]